MATTTLRITHERAGDLAVASNARLPQVISRLQNFLQGGIAGNYAINAIELSQDPATGTVTLSGVDGVAATGSYALSSVGGTAATGTVTLGGGAGDVTITVAGNAVGPVPFNTSDAQTALDAIAAINLDVGASGFVTASSGGSAVVLLTANEKGVLGNLIGLEATRTAGTATVSDVSLSGGQDGAVTVVINGTSVGPTNTTDLSDTAAATAVAAAIEANGTLGPLLTAVGSTTNVNLTWGTKGVVGNAATLAAGVSTTGTATRSGATLSGGADNEVTVTVGGEAVATDTTTLSNSAAATAVAAEINANATAADYVTASAESNVVTLTALSAGEEGNGISLSAVTTNGTATASGSNLTGGTSTTHTR